MPRDATRAIRIVERVRGDIAYMKVLHGTLSARTNDTDEATTTAPRGRTKESLLAPLGALFLGGVVAFGKPRDALEPSLC